MDNFCGFALCTFRQTNEAHEEDRKKVHRTLSLTRANKITETRTQRVCTVHRTTMPSTKITTHVHTLILLSAHSTLHIGHYTKTPCRIQEQKKVCAFQNLDAIRANALIRFERISCIYFSWPAKKNEFFLLRCRFVCFYFHPILDIQRMQWHTIENVVAL